MGQRCRKHSSAETDKNEVLEGFCEFHMTPDAHFHHGDQPRHRTLRLASRAPEVLLGDFIFPDKLLGAPPGCYSD